MKNALHTLGTRRVRAHVSLAGLALTLALGCASRSTRRVSVVQPGAEASYQKWQFAQAVRVGNTIWVSGQVGVDASTGQVPNDIVAQSSRAFENLEATLRHAGADLRDIVELVTYHTSMDELAAFAAVKSRYIEPPYPAWTAVGVQALGAPAWKVEIRATAVVGSGRGAARR